MARRNIGGKRYARKFNKTRGKTRAINNPQYSMRGGIRL